MDRKTDKNNFNIDKDEFIILLKRIWKGKKLILKITSFFFILGIVYSITLPNIFRSSSTFYPHYDKVDNTGNLRNLAGLAGINIENEVTSNIPPNLYPNLIKSTEFKKKILNEKFVFNKKEITYKEYLINQKKILSFNEIIKIPLKFIIKIISKSESENPLKNPDLNSNNLTFISESDYRLFQKLDENIILNVFEKDGFIELSVLDRNAEVSAIIAIKANDILQKSIINFKIKNISELYEFTSKQLDISKKNLYLLQDSLANFKDSNKNIKSDLFRNQLSRIETEFNLSKNLHNELAITKERTAIDVRKNTPIFTIINPVVVPNSKYKPVRVFISITYLIFGFFISLLWILFKEYIFKFYNSVIK